ncbi:hypothetical protein P7C70_g3603, partial [Phenoliferia sp. Uapishka_3]
MPSYAELPLFTEAGITLPYSDLTIVSSDDKLFHVHKFNLASASITFSDMLEVGESGSEVALVEPAAILARLLPFAYPHISENIKIDIESDFVLLEALFKYEVTGGIEAVMRELRWEGPPLPPPPTPGCSFRDVERYWKTRRGTTPPNLAYALDPDAIIWSSSSSPGSPRRGIWTNTETREEVVCWKVQLEDMSSCGMGQTGWKGKEREGEAEGDENDWGVVIPALPGLVLLPAILPPTLQRSLTMESLRHSVLPNLTSLSAHYTLPSDGLWHAWESGRGEEKVPRIDSGKVVEVARRERVDFEPVTEANFQQVGGRGEVLKMGKDSEEREEPIVVKEVESTVAKLLPKLRWTTIGYSYDWTSKTYDFDRSAVPLPPLIEKCCREAVRAVPWKDVFPDEAEEIESNPSVKKGKHWQTWAEWYRPEAGVINFYQLSDSLTAHIDQSEVDAVRPLSPSHSFPFSLKSIGHSSIFLVGGPTRDTTPLSIILRSGDGLLMSGPKGRRVFHGLPRVLNDTLPEYLASDCQCPNVEDPNQWKAFGEYLEGGTRLNINVREVF